MYRTIVYRLRQLLPVLPMPAITLPAASAAQAVDNPQHAKSMINQRPPPSHRQLKKRKGGEEEEAVSVWRRRRDRGSRSRRGGNSWSFDKVNSVPNTRNSRQTIASFTSRSLSLCLFLDTIVVFHAVFSISSSFLFLLLHFFSNSFSLFVCCLLAHNPFSSLCALFVHASRQHLIDRIHFDWSDRRCW